MTEQEINGSFQDVQGGGSGTGTGEKAIRFKFENVGDKVVGVIVKQMLDKVGKYDTSDVYIVKTVKKYNASEKTIEFGESVMFSATGTVLKERLRNCKQDDFVLIQYLGKPAGKKYKMFKVQKDASYNGGVGFTSTNSNVSDVTSANPAHGGEAPTVATPGFEDDLPF